MIEIRGRVAALLRLLRIRRRTFDVSPYVPKFNDWLSIADHCQGRATIRFRDPQGSLEGDADMLFNETGEVRIEVRLDPATLHVDRGESGGLLPFIWPGRSWTVDGRTITSRNFSDPLNPCARLETLLHSSRSGLYGS